MLKLYYISRQRDLYPNWRLWFIIFYLQSGHYLLGRIHIFQNWCTYRSIYPDTVIEFHFNNRSGSRGDFSGKSFFPEGGGNISTGGSYYIFPLL